MQCSQLIGSAFPEYILRAVVVFRGRALFVYKQCFAILVCGRNMVFVSKSLSLDIQIQNGRYDARYYILSYLYNFCELVN